MTQNHKVLSVCIKQTGDRNTTRKLVVDTFADEEPGTGRGSQASRYRYNVETISDGRVVYLTRPARLKAGFDFVIHVEGCVFGNGRDYPTHGEIISDLKAKSQDDPVAYLRLHEALERVFGCQDPDDILPEYQDLYFESGMPVEDILKTVKWLFIEQDIRYWNYSGRGMLKGEINQVMQ